MRDIDDDIAIAEMLELEPVRWGKPDRYAHAGWMLLIMLACSAITTCLALYGAWELMQKFGGGM
jgi:hypothetical protein